MFWQNLFSDDNNDILKKLSLSKWNIIGYAGNTAQTSSTNCGRVTHICLGNLTIIGSDNGLSHDRCQNIIWANAGILLMGRLETNFTDYLIKIHTVSFKKTRLKISAAKWLPFCLGLNMLTVGMWLIVSG